MKTLFTLALLLLGIDCFAVGNLYVGSFQGDGSGLTNVAQSGIPMIPAGTHFSGASYTLTNLPVGNYIVTLNGGDGALVELDASDLSVTASLLQGSNQTFTVTDAVAANPFTLTGTGSQLILSQVYQLPNQVVGGILTGTFVGNISSNSIVPDSALNTDVLKSTGQIIGFTHDSAQYQHILVSSNTHSGSTLGVKNISNHGYADINFIVGGTKGNDFDGTLVGAIGHGVQGTNQFPYNESYLECYGLHSWWFVAQGGAIYGGANGTNGDFVWYSNKTTDTDETTKIFDIVRATPGIATYSTNTLIVTATGLTNATAVDYLVSVTAGTGLVVKDGNGNQFLAPVLNNCFPLKPNWRFTGTAVTGIAVQFP